MPRQFHLGHFIKLHHVQKALTLLTLQIEQKSPLYNNLDFTIYRKSGVDKIAPETYYEQFILRDTLYYFEHLFYVETYHGIQRAYKTREYHFLSLHAAIIYYAIGFYIRELMDKRMRQEQERLHRLPVHVYYGGSLHYDTPESSNIFYYEDYKEFLVYKEKLTMPEEGKVTFAVSLDIKSFFYTIDHKILLDIIDKTSPVAVKQALHFDEQTKLAIGYLLNYFQGSGCGLPVANQNLISNFLSNLYLSVFDKYVIDHYIYHGDTQYIRYVDDFYLIFRTTVDEDIRTVRKRFYDIENDFSAFLMANLNLEISTGKSERYEIRDVESQIEFLKASSLESPFDQEFDLEDMYENSLLKLDIAGKPVPDIFQQCIAIIEGLKRQTNQLAQLNLSISESAYLNHILILKSCLSYSKSRDAIEMMEQSGIFDELKAIDYLLIKPKVMFHLMTVSQPGRENLFNFIIDNLNTPGSLLPKLTITDKFLHQIIFLISEAKPADKSKLQTEFERYKQNLIGILSILQTQNPHYAYLDLIVEAFSEHERDLRFSPMYKTDFLNKDLCIPLGQQIKLRRLSEVAGSYSVSFNHLLNEFQNVFEIVYFNSEQKAAKDIMMKMQDEKYSTAEIEFVSNFFERRNQNSISHTNTHDIGLWNVTQMEYADYKNRLIPIIDKLYQTLRLQEALAD
ncbi:hypothetical protein [Arcticibacter sp. MXS-1]|uniref:hypothetical protein n=1 Tax=Arcticibacter sp. MXS-1 TaxID=3341726 RepID=UPI0035A8A297